MSYLADLLPVRLLPGLRLVPLGIPQLLIAIPLGLLLLPYQDVLGVLLGRNSIQSLKEAQKLSPKVSQTP